MFLLILAYLAFFSIALPDSMLGVAWPSMRISFDQSIGAAGLIPPFGVAATIVSTLATRHVVARIGIGRLLVCSTCLSAVGLTISAASPSLAVFLIGVVVLGLSGGAIDVTLNVYAARHFGPRRINLMHASYVVGAAASPALVTLALQVGASWRWPYATIAALQLLLGGIFAVGATRWQSSGTAPSSQASRTDRDRLLTLQSGVGIAAVVVQTGIESSAALWAYTFLTLSAGVSDGVAGLTVSGFWLMMFTSRVVLGSMAERIGSWTIMSLSVVGLLTSATLTAVGTLVPTAAILGVLTFGIAAGPMYPLLVLTTPERTTPGGSVDRLVAAQAAASAVGAATLPLLFGLAMNTSPSAFAPVMAAAAGTAALLHLTMRTTKAPTHEPTDRH